MNKQHGLKIGLFACGAIFILFTGCVSLMEKTGRALDGSSEKTIAVYKTEKNAAHAIEIREVRNRAGERSLLISPGGYPAMKLRGTIPGENGEFILTSLDYLAGSSQGWNEYRLDIIGSGKLIINATTATFSIQPEIDAVQISSGRIKRFDTRITGDEALSSLRNRRERITALAEWMNSVNEVNGVNGVENVPVMTDLKNFNKYWKPVLFPELVSKSKQPAGWNLESDQFARAEDIRWNTGYTERAFPEILREIRNSGTMLRDWEEAVDWIYIEYHWDKIMEILSMETVLYK